MLNDRGYEVYVYILEFGHKGTNDFQANLSRLHHCPRVDIHFIQDESHIPSIPGDAIIIDALFGSGLNRSLDGVTASLVKRINDTGAEVISIDIPSGMFVDHSSKGNRIINATHTLSFQVYKPAFLFAENEFYTGRVHILNISLHPEFYLKAQGEYELLDDEMIQCIYRPRNLFAHKGNFGHALLVAGSYGKMGAAVLAARGCLRSGAGLVTCHIPQCGYDILQSAVPEAMVLTDFNSSFNTRIEDDLDKYDSIGIGPGLGQASETKQLLHELLSTYRKPLVLDADALNIISMEKELFNLVPGGSLLTPHPREFERLFGESANDYDRVHLAVQKAREYNIIIILKGHHTFIATPGEKAFFNNTGNAGMATPGSGDVLTGILTALLGQGYSPTETAVLGVYLHGLAGDVAAKELSMESLIAGDLVRFLGKAFLRITKN
jgi:NAD(P)H-hydrate epimerase